MNNSFFIRMYTGFIVYYAENKCLLCCCIDKNVLTCYIKIVIVYMRLLKGVIPLEKKDCNISGLIGMKGCGIYQKVF